MPKCLKAKIYDAVESSLAITYNDDAELLSDEVWAVIRPLIIQIQEMRLHQRVYAATKTDKSLQIARQAEKHLDDYLGILEDEKPLQQLIF